jgi:hypothetical protein
VEIMVNCFGIFLAGRSWIFNLFIGTKMKQPFYNSQWPIILMLVMAGIGTVAALFFIVKIVSWIIFLIK